MIFGITNTIQRLLKKLPDTPGIYLFYTAKKELIYVGKATSLKDRVRSYFSGQKNFRPIEQMIHEVADIKWKTTESVLEAIILEGEHIKNYLPKYNVEWKDDKSWNYIVITRDEYPRIITVRSHELKNIKYSILNIHYSFGPYPGLNTRAMMKLLQKLFYFSICQPNQKRPCLYRQMGQCLGVCTGEISPKEYRARVIRPLVTFLRGKKKQVIKDFEKRMKAASKAENFEEAARLRNQITSLQRIYDIALLNKNFVQDSLPVTGYPLPVIRIEGYDISNLGSTGKVGSMVVFTDGEADKSQYRKFKIKTVDGQSDVDCLEEVLQRRLKHACDTNMRINANVVNHANKDYWPLPDLFLIDGGKPQVNRAKKVLREAQVSVPIVGIAKGQERKRNDFLLVNFTNADGDGTNREMIHWVERNKSLLIRVRDEAHRFAIAYQRKLRRM